MATTASVKITRAALYGRVSTTGHGQNVELQMEELRVVAQQRGWLIAGEYVDEGISGLKDRRPGLDRLLADAKAGKIDVLMVWRLDRLGRSLQHLLQVLDSLTAMGVGFLSARDSGIDTTTAQGRLMLSIIGAFAEFERHLIVERVRAGVARAQAAGKHCGRPEVDVDMRPALGLLREGRGLREVAKILKMNRATLRTRLQAAGFWPLPDTDGVVNNPPLDGTDDAPVDKPGQGTV